MFEDGGISTSTARCPARRPAIRHRPTSASSISRHLAAHHEQLEVWAENCPENFENRAALVGAEIARIEGRELDAERLYEQAIRSARANGFVHNEALANELAARFYAARGFETIAHALSAQRPRTAISVGEPMARCGNSIELYPHLREEEPAPAPTSTIGAPVEHLDLATVIKVSQAVSGEIVLEKLIDTLMRTAIEQAGAERGLLILPRGAEQRIEAEATTSGDTVDGAALRDEPVTATDAPGIGAPLCPAHPGERDSRRCLSPVPVCRGSVHPSSARPVQFSACRCSSRAKLIGVLYLENNLAPRVFTPARIAVLKLLASQAAISLENTRLYRDLAEREAKIRRLVDANIIGIFVSDIQGQVIEANDAFLHMVGYDREDLASGRVNWANLTPPEWRDRDVRTAEEVKAIGTVQPFEKEFFHKNGSRIPVLIGVAAFDERRVQVVGFVLELDRAQASGSRSTRQRAPLSRSADRAGARRPRRNDGAAHGFDRS